MKRNTIQIKRVYDVASTTDGYRVLVDRLWPRGLKKSKVTLDEWCKEIAPTTELRKWFGHKPENFKRFSELYKVELKVKSEELKRLKSISLKQTLTLLYAAKDEKFNHAVVLRNVLK